jgi:hypothetical protein
VIYWDWFAIFAIAVGTFLLMRIAEKLDRIIRLLEIANDELRYPNLEAHKRDMMGDR